jgi:hypothetical protein
MWPAQDPRIGRDQMQLAQPRARDDLSIRGISVKRLRQAVSLDGNLMIDRKEVRAQILQRLLDPVGQWNLEDDDPTEDEARDLESRNATNGAGVGGVAQRFAGPWTELFGPFGRPNPHMGIEQQVQR